MLIVSIYKTTKVANYEITQPLLMFPYTSFYVKGNQGLHLESYTCMMIYFDK